ncbi:MAG: hypothetical protein AMXMBFR12_04460 [Candidatus Babeliales bacterium]
MALIGKLCEKTYRGFSICIRLSKTNGYPFKIKTSRLSFLPRSKRTGWSCLLLSSLITTSLLTLAESNASSIPFASVNSIISEVAEQKKQDHMVRVLLNESRKPYNCKWEISAKEDLLLGDPEAQTKRHIKNNKVTVTYSNKQFFIDGQPLSLKRFYLIPVGNTISFEGREYHGSLLFTRDTAAIYAINVLDIEDYVCSVLKTESWPGWPLEVNKAFAIASRSYIMGIIKNKPTTPYHVKNTKEHQTYSGVHDNPVLKEAVAQTKGIYLADQKNEPVLAMFDSCCGGVIPADILGVDFVSAPYLARTYPCIYCKDCRMYNWSIEYPIAHLEKTLKKEIKHLKNMHAVKIAKTDKAGLVQHVSVKSKHANHNLSGKKLYSLLSKVRSFHFTVDCNKTHIKFTGKGVGHHIGLCQWGAREMVAQGYDYKSILNFYYPGTHFMRLS